MPQLIAATRNPAKVRALARLVEGHVEVVPLPTGLGDGEPPEGDASLAANAAEKARFWSRHLGTDDLVVATDGGLVIPALGDRWNPARTRRFAGDAATDLDRARALLRLASDLSDEQRQIVWQEALAVAANGEVVAQWLATSAPGVLSDKVDPAEVVAEQEFWIPAIWRCPEFGGRTIAALTPNERAARHDHWQELGTSLRAFLAGYRRNRS